MRFAAPNRTGGGGATGVDGAYKAKCGYWESTGFDWIQSAGGPRPLPPLVARAESRRRPSAPRTRV